MGDTQRSVKLRIVADAGTAKETLDDIIAKTDNIDGKKSSVRINLDAGTTKEQLDEIIAKADALGIKNVTFAVKADTADANAKVDETAAKVDDLAGKSPTVKIDIDALTAEAKIEEVEAQLDALNGKNVKATISLQVLGWTGAGFGIGAALTTLPGLIGGAGAAAGVGALAFGGLSKALSDSAAQSNATGGASSHLASTEISNAIAIQNAQRAISDARTQAAHDATTSAQSVASAEEQLKTAEGSEQSAQESLTEARQQAVLTLEQLNNAQADGALSAEQAALSLQEAQQNQAQVDATATSTALQRAQADLSVREAQQALTEAQQNAKNTTDAANKANQEGINGLPGVVSAQQSYANSVKSVADAQRNLTQTQQQAAWTQQKDTEAIKVAVQNLSNTYKEQAAAAQSAGGAGSAAANKFAKDMAALSPEARRFVNQLLAMKTNLHSLETTAQNEFLPGVSTFLLGVKSLLPEVTGEVKQMGGILGGAFYGAGIALRSSGIHKEIEAIFQEGNQFVKTLLPAIGGVLGSFLGMGAKSGDAVKGLAKGLADILKGVSDLFNNLSGNGGPKAFGQIFEALGKAIGTLGGPLGQIIVALAKGLAPIAVALAPIIGGLARAIGAIFKAIPPSLMTGLITFLTAVTIGIKIWGEEQVALDVALEANPIGIIITAVAALIAIIVIVATKTRFFQDIWHAAWGAITTAFDAAFDWIKGHWPLIEDILIGPVGIAIKWIVQHWSDIVNGAKSAIDSVTSFFSALPGRILSVLSGLATDMWNIGVSIVQGIWNGIASMGSWLWNSIVGFVKSFIMSPVKDVLSILSPSKVFHGYGQFTIRGFMDGVKSMHSALSGTMAATANLVSDSFYGNVTMPGPSGFGAGGRGGGGVTFAPNITVTGVVGDAGATGKEIAKALNTYLRQTGQGQLVGA